MGPGLEKLGARGNMKGRIGAVTCALILAIIVRTEGHLDLKVSRFLVQSNFNEK